MKNIHLLPTEKPSRLMIDTIENKLYFQPILHEKTANVLTQHIYITSDEEIKDVINCAEVIVPPTVKFCVTVTEPVTFELPFIAAPVLPMVLACTVPLNKSPVTVTVAAVAFARLALSMSK